MPSAGRRTRLDQLLPFGYIGAALLLAVILLPSALRPPLQQPDQSGAFSPNAPPNKNQTLYAGAHAADSGTFGGTQAGSGPGGSTPSTLPPPPQQQGNQYSACPYGVGNPPRQIASVYAPPCAPAFTGNNGGATSPGVTANTINICYLMNLTGADSSGGPIPQQETSSEGGVARTYTVLMNYFNSRYQFYGRKMQWYYVSNPSGSNSTANAYARADAAKNTYHCFASIEETNADELDELAHDGIIAYTLAQVPESYFQSKDPYIWSFTPSATSTIKMGVEYYCKKLAGKPPTYTNDPTFNYKAPRKVGLIVYDLPEYGNMSGYATSLLRQECGVTPAKVVTYDLTGSGSGTQGLSTDVVQLRAAGVTTVFYLGDLLSAAIFTEAAYSNNYYPEWYLPGFGGVDTGHIGRDYNGYEWVHAFGYSFYEVPRPDEETECYQAYHQIDPNNDPDSGMCNYMWGDMVQLFGGIQEAGPHLTPQKFRQALINQPKLPPDPPWHMAGGYADDNHTFPLWAAEIWWDPNSLGSDGQPGTYRYLNNGQRYTFGGWPSGDDPGLFHSGITMAPGS
ncbi:MAG TPA: hypothetical protein VE990_19090 [Acidimicrobiales bacterium]|nr:hypothetical protein [Acidimicrobiales bacterium]